MNNFIKKLVFQQKKATAKQLRQLAAHVASTPFADALLDVEEPLWGGFWQGDVISPGYRLPAVELAWLRAVRLDKSWSQESTVVTFLADLRRTILDPQSGVWTLRVAGQPCVVFVGGVTVGRFAKRGGRRLKVGKLQGGRLTKRDKRLKVGGLKVGGLKVKRLKVGRLKVGRLKVATVGRFAKRGRKAGRIDRGKASGEADEGRERKEKGREEMVTVVWYCASTGRLHAGYRVMAGNFVLPKARPQRRWKEGEGVKFRQPDQPDWLEVVVNRGDPAEETELAARLDVEILRIRSGQAGHDR